MTIPKPRNQIKTANNLGRARLSAHAKNLNYGSYEYYRDYKHLRDILDHELVDKDTHRGIMESLFTKIGEKIVTDSEIFHLPYRLGSFYVQEYKTETGKYVDWPASRKKGKKVYKYNLLTGGKGFRFYWDKSTVPNRLLRCFRFEPVDWLKGKLTNIIRDTYSDPMKKNYSANL